MPCYHALSTLICSSLWEIKLRFPGAVINTQNIWHVIDNEYPYSEVTIF